MTQTITPPQTIALVRCGLRDPGATLGLRAGDVLIGVEGKAWAGGIDALAARFSAARRPLLLTFMRGETGFDVLATTADLGRWQACAMPASPPPLQSASAAICNWQILRHHDGQYDLVALRPSLLALIAPPLWLAQGRLLTWLTAMGAALALALPAGALLMGCVWIAAGLHLWRHGAAHLLQARQIEGYHRAGMIAAPREGAAMQAWARLVPDAQFRYLRDHTSGAAADPIAAE